jgi:hypothetical protein
MSCNWPLDKWGLIPYRGKFSPPVPSCPGWFSGPPSPPPPPPPPPVSSTTLMGFSQLNCHWAFSAGRIYRMPLPVARQTPNVEENQGFRVFQLSSQEAPSVWSDTSEPSSGRWNYGREMAEKFCRKWGLPRHFWVLLHAVKHDMGQMALPLLQRKVCWGFFARKIWRLRPGLNPRTWVPKASTLPLDHRSRSYLKVTVYN